MKKASIFTLVLPFFLILFIHFSANAQAPSDTCASEGERCWFPGTAEVAYGAGNKWTTKVLRGGFNCGVSTFGSDPAYGTLKTCRIVNRDCAREGGRCEFDGWRTVKYGANGAFVKQTFRNGVACSNDAFGRDPAPGVPKQCYFSTPDEKPINNITWLGMHNAISSYHYGYIIQNSQRDSITAQLDRGARALEIDIVYDSPPDFVGVPQANRPGVYTCHCGKAPHSDSDIEKARGLKWDVVGFSFKLPGWTHGTPYMRLNTALKEIDRWLAANPDEIVIVLLENNSADATQFDAEVNLAGITSGIYRKTGTGAWPKKSELIRTKQRLILGVGQDDNQKLDAASSNYATARGQLAWDGNIHPPSKNGLLTNDFTGEENKLRLLGVFHTETPNELVAGPYNDYKFLNSRKIEWQNQGITLLPSVIQFNHIQVGDPLRFINDLNGVDYLIPSKADAIGDTSGDSWQIKFQNEGIFNAGMDVVYYVDEPVPGASGITIPVPKVIQTNTVSAAVPARIINIPRNISKKLPVQIAVKLYSTSNFDLFTYAIPPNHTGSPMLCFRAYGILTSAKGGMCE